MAIEQFEAAESQASTIVEWCLEVLRHLDNGLITPEEAEIGVDERVTHLLGALDEVFTSSPDPRDDLAGLVLRTQAAIGEVERLFDEHPGTLRTPPCVWRVRGFLESRAHQADEVVRLAAVIAAWEDADPALAPRRRRLQAVQTLDQAAQLHLKGSVLKRMVRAGLHAFGPRWAVDLAASYLDHHMADKSYWELVLGAMDELAAWASATELYGIPSAFQRRAISALIEIAGYPELTQWAVSRVPLHRLTGTDRRELAELLSDWYSVMPIDWISEPQKDGTLAIEVTYLRALEGAATSWPGDPRAN